jgi:hypothetical protein
MDPYVNLFADICGLLQFYLNLPMLRKEIRNPIHLLWEMCCVTSAQINLTILTFQTILIINWHGNLQIRQILKQNLYKEINKVVWVQ